MKVSLASGYGSLARNGSLGSSENTAPGHVATAAVLSASSSLVSLNRRCLALAPIDFIAMVFPGGRVLTNSSTLLPQWVIFLWFSHVQSL